MNFQNNNNSKIAQEEYNLSSFSHYDTILFPPSMQINPISEVRCNAASPKKKADDIFPSEFRMLFR